ncbi:MAG: DUF202 domain-containing protein [Deltaproteobacteria bacterium]|nr:DUF202 domain-containing protein [Deltaproteobacteria bacterium]RKX29326.1 MAG: DUF202 domain-containing protein [candidate division Zixibacteria bacterium]HDL02879.1 DUF202 domain-containing protein [candidate division Zixibacteria bacterium]
MFHGIEFKKSKNSPGLNEQLNAARTILANERTLLSYIRTALALFIAGLTFVRFFDNRIIEIIGWVFIPLGLINLVLGIVRYRATRNHIDELDLPFKRNN